MTPKTHDFVFNLRNRDGNARLGSFSTPHGVFDTPTFMPVGTKATVKGVDVERLQETGASVMLVNTYHLWLRPGPELVSSVGGIHAFSGWKGPILSDSGGYQVFSLKAIRDIKEEGVTFRSHLDGARMFLSPEIAVSIQERLGVDIAMAFDECPAAGLDYDAVARSLDMTLRWADRCLNAKTRDDMALFGITQGGRFPDLRSKSAAALRDKAFDGFAIGGLSVGEEKSVMYEILSSHVSELPDNKIRYLMGVGTPQDLVQGVYEGIDLFDCVMPTRSGRFGRAFVGGDQPYLNLRNARFLRDTAPLEEDCQCIACRNYSRSYLHHLFRCDEMLGPQLLSVHNLHYYLGLMSRIRSAIQDGVFGYLYHAEMSRWKKKVDGLGVS